MQIPATKITRKIATILLSEELIDSFGELRNGLKNFLILSLKYNGKEAKPKIEKIKRLSKPGLRVYTSAKKMPRVLGGFHRFSSIFVEFYGASRVADVAPK